MKMNQIIDEIKDRFENREIVTCLAMNGNVLNLDKGGISICHMATGDIEAKRVSDYRNFGVEKYYEHIYNTLNAFQDNNDLCKDCSIKKKNIYNIGQIDFVTINTCTFCQSRCIYCNGHSNDHQAIDPMVVLTDFQKNGLISKDALFDWGGGEPTENPYFDKVVNYLIENKFKQRINTNGILFSEKTYDALREDSRSVLRLSIDSGTPDCYLKVKGTDNYKSVWENIGRYREVTDNIYIKYNLFHLNSEHSEIDSFLEQCKSHGLKHIVLEAEISSYQKEKNAGPFYFRKKEFVAAHYFYDTAKEMGFDVRVSPYAFRYWCDYSGEGELILPHEYRDNIDHNVITNGIYVEPFATPYLLIKELATDERPVLLYGAGKVGERIAKILNHEGIDFGIIDSDPEKEGMAIEGHKVYAAAEALKVDCSVIVIIGTGQRKVDSILKNVNEAGIDARCYWVNQMSISNFIYEKGIL